jgi:hypothetical protein
MKHTTADALLSRELLAFVRDSNPTTAEFVERFSDSGGQVFHVLRKAGAIVVEDDRIRLSSRHLSPDATYFLWGSMQIFLDRKRSSVFMLGQRGPPNSALHQEKHD